MKTRTSPALSAAILIALAASAGSLHAQTLWTAGDSYYQTSGNWNPSLPAAGTEMQINNGGTAQINLSVTRSAVSTLGYGVGESGSLLIRKLNSSNAATLDVSKTFTIGRQGTGTVTVGGNGLANSGTFSISAGFTVVQIGASGYSTANGTLDILENGTFSYGGTASSNVRVGIGNGTGVVNINGANATMSVASQLQVNADTVAGRSTGSATINVTQGALNVTNGGGTAEIRVGGADKGGTGTVHVNGGAFTADVFSFKNVASVASPASSSLGTLQISSGSASLGTLSYTNWLATHLSSKAEVQLGGTGTLSLGGGGLLAGTTGTRSFVFDGGTLSATANYTFNSGLTSATITDNGAKVNTAGFNVEIAQALSDAAGSHGSLTKTGSGTLTLSGTNTYSGNTIVTNGVLELTHENCLSTNTAVWLWSGATNKLSFTGANTIAALYIDGVFQPKGFHGQATNPSVLDGTGFLKPLTGTPQGTVLTVR